MIVQLVKDLIVSSKTVESSNKIGSISFESGFEIVDYGKRFNTRFFKIQKGIATKSEVL